MAADYLTAGVRQGRQQRGHRREFSHDEWVFANATTANGITDYSVPLHWDGPAWAASPRITGLATTAAVAPSPGDAWLFGLVISTPAEYIAHFNGTVWTWVKLPIIPTAASASSASDVWVVGSSSLTTGGQATMHWDGSKWARVPLPPISLPPGEAYQFAGITDIAPGNVWADAVVTKGMGLAPGNVLLHWDGTAWARVRVPVALSEPGPHHGRRTRRDLAGRLQGHGRHGVLLPRRWWPLGRHAGAEHFRSRDPADVAVRIPGTRSVWAVGSILPPGGGPGLGQGGILKFGP